MLSIGELSRRSGVTVRALRYYESKGLITPIRSESRQRLYSFRDVVRLSQIQMLKRTGFTLKQIEEMIGSSNWDARAVLSVQQDLLKKQQVQVARSLTLVTDALKALDNNTSADLSTLCNIIKMGDSAMSEEKWQKVWDTYYTAEEQERWKAAKEAVPEDVQKACERNWPTLIARTEALVGTDPAAPEAQAIVKEWNAMTQVIYDVDPRLTRSAARMYDDMDNWPKDGPVSPFSKEVWDFIKAAEAAAKS